MCDCSLEPVTAGQANMYATMNTFPGSQTGHLYMHKHSKQIVECATAFLVEHRNLCTSSSYIEVQACHCGRGAGFAQRMRQPDIHTQHGALIVPTSLVSLAGNGNLADVKICYLNKSSKGTDPMQSIDHFLELAFLIFQQVKQEDSQHGGRNKSSKRMTHPMEGIDHFLELALLRRLRQAAHVA